MTQSPIFFVDFDARQSEIKGQTPFTSQIAPNAGFKDSSSSKKIPGMETIPREAQANVLGSGLTQMEPTMLVEGSRCLGKAHDESEACNVNTLVMYNGVSGDECWEQPIPLISFLPNCDCSF